MVSKIAVIALVAIVACPILLGYAFNLSETTETDYKTTGDSVNVTQLLRNDTAYTYAQANTYQLNTDFSTTNNNNSKIYPNYVSKGTDSSNLYLEQRYQSTPGSIPPNVYLNTWFHLYALNVMDNSASNGVILNLYENGTLAATLSNVEEIFFVNKDNTVFINGVAYTGSNMNITWTTVGTPVCTFFESWYTNGATTNQWVDFSGGYRFYGTSADIWCINTPDDTKSFLMTIDLDSITDPNYTFEITTNIQLYYMDYMPITYPGLLFNKTTDGLGNVTWTVKYNLSSETPRVIYYDPSISHNTYQLYWDVKSYDYASGTKIYDIPLELRYVGDWPALIGEANAYKTYTYNLGSVVDEPYDLVFEYIKLSTNSTSSPIIRMDDALYTAFTFPCITNKSYDPAAFKTNPATTITDIQMFGGSLTFAGINYTVKDGKITVAGHQLNVKDLVFKSIPNAGGTYDNMIGNTLISTSANPSTIAFNGQWSASVSTQSMESYTYTKTEWNVGSFGWDGIDQNFLIVGLITCLGVFVALGIYARKRGTGGIIPLMIVTGCAAAVFFIML